MTNEPIKYEKHILNLQNMEGFLSMFWEMIYHFNNHEEAYDECESIFMRYFDRRRFADYESFKSSKSQYLKKLHKERSKCTKQGNQ
jgi:hypothetical protein